MDGLEWQEIGDYTTRLVVAAILGGVLGLEREWKGRWAGLRTHMMVSLGCAIFSIVGMVVSVGQPDAVTRVIQGVATGIGFLGAGTILKLSEQREIKGLTTAGSIWLAAALGTAAGLAEYALAIAGAVISLFVLGVLGPVEKMYERRQTRHGRPREESDS